MKKYNNQGTVRKFKKLKVFILLFTQRLPTCLEIKFAFHTARKTLFTQQEL